MKKLIIAAIIIALILWYFGKQKTVSTTTATSGTSSVTPLSNNEVINVVHTNAGNNLTAVVVTPGRYDYLPVDVNPILVPRPTIG